MEKAETVAGVHTHTHTRHFYRISECNLIEKNKLMKLALLVVYIRQNSNILSFCMLKIVWIGEKVWENQKELL